MERRTEQWRTSRTKRSPNTAVVSVRLDVRTLANFAEFYINQGEFITSKPQVIKMALEDLQELLMRRKLMEPLTSTVDAMEILDKAGLLKTSIHSGGRGGRTYMHQLQKEDGDLPSDFNPMRDVRRRTKVDLERSENEFMKVTQKLVEDGTLGAIRQQIDTANANQKFEEETGNTLEFKQRISDENADEQQLNAERELIDLQEKEDLKSLGDISNAPIAKEEEDGRDN